MESVFQSIKELKLFFADLITTMTGLQSNRVLIQFPERGSATQDINTNMIYIDIEDETDIRNIYKTREKVYSGQDNTYKIQQQSTRTLCLRLIGYGKDIYEFMRVISEKMYFDSIKLFLDQNYLYLIPDRSNGPTYTHELKNDRWYQRADLELRFYNPIVVEDKVGIFSGANINIKIDK